MVTFVIFFSTLWWCELVTLSALFGPRWAASGWTHCKLKLLCQMHFLFRIFSAYAGFIGTVSFRGKSESICAHKSREDLIDTMRYNVSDVIEIRWKQSSGTWKPWRDSHGRFLECNPERHWLWMWHLCLLLSPVCVIGCSRGQSGPAFLCLGVWAALRG